MLYFTFSANGKSSKAVASSCLPHYQVTPLQNILPIVKYVLYLYTYRLVFKTTVGTNFVAINIWCIFCSFFVKQFNFAIVFMKLKIGDGEKYTRAPNALLLKWIILLCFYMLFFQKIAQNFLTLLNNYIKLQWLMCNGWH